MGACLLSSMVSTFDADDVATISVASAEVVGSGVELQGRAPVWSRQAGAIPWWQRRPSVVIVIDDLGLDRERTASLNELSAPLTLAFLPHATALAQQTRSARAAGHELLLHVPMEPIGEEWPGPAALSHVLDRQELVSRLRAHLRSFRGFVGINNHMGSRLTADRERMAWVMDELRTRQLLFVDSLTTGRSVATEEARRYGVPYARRDIFLDNEPDLDEILGQLVKVERIAKRRGYAIAIGHPHDMTIAALRLWLPTLEERGLRLVPVSTIVAWQVRDDLQARVGQNDGHGSDTMIAADHLSTRR